MDNNTPQDLDQYDESKEDGLHFPSSESSMATSDKKNRQRDGENSHLHLSGMFQGWFLDYASYVILERAIPNIKDGLKPVQRRILHSMKRMDDGRYNKVANIIGHTMQFHPHGDASIGDALVQIGQKELLVDCQGNWGNILTGDGAAAPRYIEARLSPFANEVLFNAKTTQWQPSYDGRNKEPITLPVKFPLLLTQGIEGIAVGLSSKILPHNFVEVCQAAISYLKGEDFSLYPDFPTGGYVDVDKYNDGKRGGSIKIRAKISKLDNRTLVISEIPYGRTTASVVDSILKANEKGKIKIKKVDDITAKEAAIHVHLTAGVSSDKAIDALYAFTDCEISLSPNCCVINDNKPAFVSISDVLQSNTDNTRNLLKQENEIERAELLEQLLFASLEKIFIEERIYKDAQFENATDIQQAIRHIASRIEKYKSLFVREVTNEDLQRLMEIRMARILKFNAQKAEEAIANIKKRIEQVEYNLTHITQYTINWFSKLQEKYGKNQERRTEIRSFDTIEATKVAEANEKLFINREEGFIGTSLKKDEFVANCSDLDDVLIIYRDGRFKVVKVSDKMFVGKNILYINIFKRNDTRTIYNIVYRNGQNGTHYIKRFAITGITRDKEYDLTQGKSGSRIIYFTANANGEAETIKVTLKPKPRQKILSFEKDFSEIAIKGRQSMGNILTKAEVHRITLKQRGASTLGGREVWFDADVLRINYEGRGRLLGEFFTNDLILVMTEKGEYYTSNFDLSNHFESGIIRIEKFSPRKVWTCVLFDADQQYFYLKRFTLEPSSKPQSFIGENPKSYQVLLSSQAYPRISVAFGGNDQFRDDMEIEADEFIGVKSVKARGKRISTYQVETVTELTPTKEGSNEEDTDTDEELYNNIPAEQNEKEQQEDSLSDDELRDEILGQTRLKF